MIMNNGLPVPVHNYKNMMFLQLFEYYLITSYQVQPKIKFHIIIVSFFVNTKYIIQKTNTTTHRFNTIK